ncbi:class I glutamine amidotransferase-like protein [Chaetomidium leptoderma]|uniref:glutaminase n=1 Tax=Chaetomidium leptoderma TaxID=669021 RepID=A0AAN6ZZF0_9PEZI|nr:class I glutamine amidotransferase-like protein [Chaetomidium leptoderma]
MPQNLTVGVLALQGGVVEHLNLLRKAAAHIQSSSPESLEGLELAFTEVRTTAQLTQCSALIIPGGESTTMAIVARRLGLLDPLREFVKVQHKPVWGTCAGLVMLAEQASATKQGGQELVGGLDVKVLRNRYGTQMQSFVAGLDLGFLGQGEEPFRAVFIRAPIVEEVNIAAEGGGCLEQGGKGPPVEVLAVYHGGEGQKQAGEGNGKGDIVAVRQGNVFGTSFHPELTNDVRIHVWWLRQVLDAARHGKLVVNGV